MPFSLPNLPYEFNALEPHIDAKTMEIHHGKHHFAYVTKANEALAKYPELQSKTAEELLKNLSTVPEDIRTAVRNNVGGHWNHSFFWESMRAGMLEKPSGKVGEDIIATFGSFTALQELWAKEAVGRFGSGWVWLIKKDGKLTVVSTPNQDSPVMDGIIPLLGLDVWEHAYYLNYQNRRPDYVTAWWNVVNWAKVEERYLAQK